MKKWISTLLAFSMVLSVCMGYSVSAQDIMKIEAEGYSSYYDNKPNTWYVQNGGTGRVVSFDKTEWMQYSLNIATAGLYKLTVSTALASATTLPELSAIINETERAKVNLPVTGDFSIYQQTVVGQIPLTAGNVTLKLLLKNKAIMFDYFTLEYVGEYVDSLLDNNKIEAEDADEDTPAQVTDGIVTLPDAQGLNYTVNTLSAKAYKVSVNASGSGTIKLFLNGALMTERSISQTSAFVTMTLCNIGLPKGKSVLRLEAAGTVLLDYFNINVLTPESSAGEAVSLKYEAEAYNNSYDPTTGNVPATGTHPNRSLSFNAARWVEFNITIPKTGNYQLTAFAAIGPDYAYDTCTIAALSGETELCRGIVKKTSSWSDWQPFVLGGFRLPSGAVTIRLLVINSACFLNYFVLDYLGNEMELHSVYSTVTPIVHGANLARGADSFVMNFTQPVKASSVNSGTVQLMQGNVEIPMNFVVNGKTVTATVQNTLEYDRECSLSIKGITDLYGVNSIKDEYYTFRTDGVDSGGAYVEIKSATIDHNKVTISGIMQSSQKTGIAGRWTELYVKSPAGAESKLDEASVLSQADGAFSLSYTIAEESQSGNYTFMVGGEYVAQKQNAVLNFISYQKEAEILNKLRNTMAVSDVKTLFDEYAQTMGLPFDSDMQNITSKDNFYAYFVGKNMTKISDFIKYYHTIVALETINQATVTSVVQSVMENAKSCGYLKLDNTKISLISTQKINLINDILALPVISDLDEFAVTCGEVVEKWIAVECGLENAQLSATDKSVYVGQGIELPLGFTKSQNDLTKAVFEVLCDETDLFTGAKVDLNVKGSVDMKRDASKLIVTVTPTKALDNISSLGVLTLTAPDTPMEHNITINGYTQYKKIYQSVDLTIKTDIVEKTIKAKVTKKDTQTSGGGGNSSHWSSGTNPVIPAPVVDENPPEDSFAFTDLSSAAWAKDSINGLLEKGVISESADKKFNPSKNITREEFVKMIVIALGLQNQAAQTNLSDVEKDKWYYSYIGIAEKTGLISGNDEGRFGIGEDITREDMSVIIYRALKNNAQISDSEKFADDNAIADYAKQAVYRMKELKMINGVGENRFEPKENATRAMAAKVIFELIKAVGK